jgi:Xaa-Pro aminopeptidase
MEIPKSEYAQRIEKVRNLMQTKDVDAVFVYHDELRMYNGCYLTGYWPTIESGAVLVPREGQPLLLGGPEASPYAKEVSAIQEMRSAECFMVPEEEYPGAVILSLPEIFTEALQGKALKRLGLVGYDIVPYGIIQDLIRAFPSAEFVDLTREYTLMRAVKSNAEIAIMSACFDLGAEGLQAAIPLIRPGATEYEVIGAAEGKMRSLGLDGFNFRGICGSGPRSNGVVPPATARKMLAGELLLFGFGPKLRGYSAGTCMSFTVDNPPSDKQRQLMIDLADALEMTRNAMKPGLKGKDIDAIPREFLTRKGYGKYLSMGFVHTVGLNEYELPFFGPNSEDVLVENITVCVDISLFNHPEFNGARHEAGYVIRSDGAHPLSKNLEDLIFSWRDPKGAWSSR